MRLPEFPVEGGCQCGAVRYRLTAAPLGVYACHCKDCQRWSGAAYQLSMVVNTTDLELLAEANPVFETLPGWQASTAEARRWEDLPEGARNYLQRIEELTGVPVWYVSVGTRRDQIIHIERNG